MAQETRTYYQILVGGRPLIPISDSDLAYRLFHDIRKNAKDVPVVALLIEETDLTSEFLEDNDDDKCVERS